MWRPTRADWKYFKGYTYLWEFGLRHVIWLNERLLELLFGIEGRYKIQMRQYLQLNDFGIDADGLERRRSYHPVFGTPDDPFADSRSSLIRRKLPFRCPRLRPLRGERGERRRGTARLRGAARRWGTSRRAARPWHVLDPERLTRRASSAARSERPSGTPLPPSRPAGS